MVQGVSGLAEPLFGQLICVRARGFCAGHRFFDRGSVVFHQRGFFSKSSFAERCRITGKFIHCNPGHVWAVKVHNIFGVVVYSSLVVQTGLVVLGTTNGANQNGRQGSVGAALQRFFYDVPKLFLVLVVRIHHVEHALREGLPDFLRAFF